MAKRVLVVEDDLLNRMLYSAVLESDGFVVELVDDGAHAIRKAREFRPDLVIMDIQLPNVSGLELIEKMHADRQLKEIPILAVTAFVGKGEEARIRRAGARGFMGKPISIRPFTEAVRNLIAGQK